MDLSGVEFFQREDIGKFKLRDLTEEILIAYSIKKKFNYLEFVEVCKF